MVQTGIKAGKRQQWITKGFNDFRKGTFGNAGHNLYVSRAGVLQRIYQYDLNHNGYFDLVFCDSQNHMESAPLYIYKDPLGQCELVKVPSNGSLTGTAVDLTGNGYDDIILGMRYDGISVHLNAFVYYGSQEGYTERRHQKLPVPWCISCTSGDFNGNGKKDLAFVTYGKVRIFYQTEFGIEATRYIDLDIEAEQLASSDLDGDGFFDLIVKRKSGEVAIYWGGNDGICKDRFTTIVPDKEDLIITVKKSQESIKKTSDAEAVDEPTPLLQTVQIGGVPYLSVIYDEVVSLLTYDSNRCVQNKVALFCQKAMSVAVGDITGNGREDIAVASRQVIDEKEYSVIFWGSENGFSENSQTKIPSFRACDILIGNLANSGFKDVVICQSHTERSFTSKSYIYRGSANGIEPDPVELQTEDARRVFLLKKPGNGKPELAFVNHYEGSLIGHSRCSIYYGSKDGYKPEARKEVGGWCAMEALYCDVNDDGYSDLVIANCAENSLWLDPGSFVHLNGPDGFSDSRRITIPTKGVMSVCCADVNRDGYLELIFAGFGDHYIRIFQGNGQGFDTQNPTLIPMVHEGVKYAHTGWMHLADLNNNGWLDLIVPQIASDRSFILWGGPDGFSFERCQPLSVHRGACIRSADLSKNGYLDLIVGGHMKSPRNGVMPPPGPHDSFVYIYWNGPEGLSEQNRTVLRADGTNCMAVADFNNDGMLDLFVGSYHNTMERDTDSFIYWNRQNIGFRQSDVTRLFTHSASGAIAADFNNDGWIDLAVANHKLWGDHKGYSEVWWNGPDGFSKQKTTKLKTCGPHGMSAVEPGNLMDRGPNEYYISAPFQLPGGAKVEHISWQAEIPDGTWVKAQIRSADSPEELEKAPWTGPSDKVEWFDNEQKFDNFKLCGNWIQYRLALGAVNALRTPRLTSVNVTYIM